MIAVIRWGLPPRNVTRNRFDSLGNRMAMFADNDIAASRGFTSVNLTFLLRVNEAAEGFQRKPSFRPTESPTTPASSTAPSLLSSLYCEPDASTRSS